MGLIDTFNPKPRRARGLYEMEIVRTRRPFDTRYVRFEAETPARACELAPLYVPDGFARRAIVMVVGVYG